ncbi:MAG: SRPBCC domain-containing protein [Gemmatimonadetes bacterium]|nr:SRPBCC domain-containing protein [Gemmatimonadota bacterium]
MPITSIISNASTLTLTVIADYPVPVERLWDAYADPRQLERFWGPEQWPATFTRHDMAVGGESHYYSAESGGMGLEYEAGVLDLYVYVESDIDTMLLIETPSGEILCDDDSHGSLNHRIQIEDPESGLYVILVGGYTQNQYHDARVFFTELDPDIFGEGAPSFILDPLFGSVELAQSFSPDPHTVSLRAGGDIDVNVGGCTVGNVSEAPSFNVRFTGSGELHFSARSDDDTTLLINTPSGEWLCDDDSAGNSNPLVSLPNAASGLYNVWVGTYSGEEARATLNISRKVPK